MNIIRIGMAAGAVLSLTGCVQTMEQRIAADDAKCQSYGVAKGSQPYIECRMLLDKGRSDVRASERFASGGGNGGVIGAIMSAGQPKE